MSVIRASRPTRPALRGTDIASKVAVNGVLGLMALYTLITRELVRYREVLDYLSRYGGGQG